MDLSFTEKKHLIVRFTDCVLRFLTVILKLRSFISEIMHYSLHVSNSLRSDKLTIVNIPSL